ncbi:MAG: tRNA-(ms[2]io[6]A)-hydroxylase [Gammaproteobacteria bacterium]|nr:MAG: tRNA-(ms[2]io[6]A)-hydroxylase [Gammaproteobacteria bacterium]
MDADLQAVLEFLPCRTPALWFDQAKSNIPTLLIDHAHCEKKAAGTALSLLFRYVDRSHLMQSLSRLAREELRHFEQVHKLLQDRGITYKHLSSSRYAAALRERVSNVEPDKLVDTLLTGAIVEARSCERFLGLIDVLPADLREFYRVLATSEARHFKDYLGLAERYAEKPLQPKLEEMLNLEASLVCEPDTAFRFHSGPLAENIPTGAD